ncbi:MAG: holo-ACP synthase [Alphaproteobacteria bacterium]|nr:holo-ACP synthase [Alphaproteobacteria bacterium]
MVIGIGIDLVDSRRIEKLYNKFGVSFLNKIYTENEINYCEKKAVSKKILSYSSRFAAKEAFSKAIGTGMSGISWIDIETNSSSSGKPTMNITGKAKEKLKALSRNDISINVSLTDEQPYAMAMVVLDDSK